MEKKGEAVDEINHSPSDESSPPRHKRTGSDGTSVGRWRKAGLGPSHALKAWMVVVLVVLIPSALFVTRIYYRLPAVLPASQVPANQFSEDRARHHLSAIVEGIGTRQGGSEACNRAKEYILNELKHIQNEKCTHPQGCATVEVDVQTSDRGSYFVDFMDHIITNTYSSVTNIVVRVSDGSAAGKQHAVLVNGHYDTGLASPGAGDDAAAISAMLEMVRAMASEVPPPNAAIFLFNGAEESLLQASHAFTTKHPWASSVRAAINLEGAGSGGPEIMFQSTSAALIHAYTASAPYPHGSVLGEELFATGAIPSDTDFRIFRDVGQWPGLDIAYYRNGYVYHTTIDDLRFVNLGSIQHLGENVLGVVRHLALNKEGSFDLVRNSSLTRPVYFDLFGFKMILYSREAMVALNWATVCLSVVTFWQTRPLFNAPLQIVPLASVFASFVAAIGGSVGTSIVMMILGKSLSWYANPLLGAALYCTPAILAMLYVQYRVRVQSKHRGINPWRLERDVSRGVLLFFTLLLVAGTLCGVGSSYYFFMWSLFSMLQLAMSFWLFNKDGSTNKTDPFRYSWRIGSLLPITVGFCINLYTLAAMMSLFFPIMGRCGAETPAEIVIAVVIGATCGLTGIGLLPAAHWAGHFRRVLKVIAVFLLLIIAVAMLTSPYTELRPKRVAIQHTTYYPNAKFNEPLSPSLNHESHTLLIHVDPLNLDKVFKLAQDRGLAPPGFQPVKFKLPHRDLTTVYPLDSFMGGYSIPAERVNLSSPFIRLLKNDYNAGTDLRTVHLKINFPPGDWSAIKFAAPLVGWSLSEELPSAPQGHYFVRHIGGYGVDSWEITLQIKGPNPFDIYACINHFEHSSDIKAILPLFPHWTVPIAFQSAGATYRVE